MSDAYKILMFMKRRPGMSVEAFRDYYETVHAPLAETFSAGIGRYMRRFLDPQPHPETGPAGELPFDVITELWYDDEGSFRRTLDYITANIMPQVITEDEAKLFDRSSFRIATVVECETVRPPA